MSSDVVSVSKLVKQYPRKETPAVDGISFSITEGEIIGLLGPNGAGKTTLIKMICGVTPPTSGTVSVFGADPVRDPVAAKARIGAMHQSGPYDQMLSALDNLKIAVRFRGVSWKAAEPWLLELVEYLGLTKSLQALVFQMSGGQRQRLQLVRALITIPKLLILDEPSAGLDVAGRHDVEKFVRWLRDEHGVTVLWTSHHIDELERNAERVLVIDRGHVLRFAHPRELVGEFGGSHVLVTVDDTPSAKVVLEWAATTGLAATADGREVRIADAAVRDILPDLLRYCEPSGTAICGASTVTDSLENAFLRMTEKAR
jgi:ABC-type multidrug transport system ATPase subunit